MSRRTGRSRLAPFVSLERTLHERAVALREAPVQRPLYAELAVRSTMTAAAIASAVASCRPDQEGREPCNS